MIQDEKIDQLKPTKSLEVIQSEVESTNRIALSVDCIIFGFDEAKLKGRYCYGGLDLSSVTDITAWVLVFPPDEPKSALLALQVGGSSFSHGFGTQAESSRKTYTNLIT